MTNSPALYLHVPFCAHICFYCDFCHLVYDRKKAERWLFALRQEMKERLTFQPFTIYLGGGTPTVLPVDQLEELLSLLDPYKDVAEYTIEINPETFDQEKAECLKRHGITRASIGLQSASAEELRSLGRHHDLEDVKRTLQLLHAVGIDNVSLDILYSFPGQTKESFRHTLETAVSLAPAHLSLYSLTIEENSVFGRQGKLPLPEDTEADFYEYAVSFLERNGYEQYEVANFAKDGQYSRHNLVYWHYEDFLGLSMGASSKLGHERSDNTRSLEEYCKGNWIKERIPLSEKDEMFEMAMMNLRLKEGLSEKRFRERFGRDFADVYPQALQKLQEKGWITEKEDHWVVNDREILNTVLLEFLD